MEFILGNKYRVIEVIGEGGMGKVYKAINMNLNTVWAIKEIKINKNLPIDFLAEPNILKNLDHYNLPRIIDIIYENSRVYIVEDFINGEALDKYIEVNGVFSEEEVIKFGKILCDLLMYLHSQKPKPIIYRDMKPSNIMYTKNKVLKLIDFGIAKEFDEETNSDISIGTKGFAAPEQYNNGKVDVRTDIYALGVTLHNLVTGVNPVSRERFNVSLIREENPKLSEGLEYIIAKATQYNPAKRYQSAKEMLFDFNNIDKLSDKYIKKKNKEKFKIYTTGTLFIASAILFFYGIKTINMTVKDNYEKIIEKGRKYSELNDMEKAIQAYDEAITYKEEFFEAYYEKALHYINNYNFNEAYRILKVEAIEKSPLIFEEDMYKYLLGTTMFYKNDYIGASELFSQIKNKNIEGLNYYEALANSLKTTNSMTSNDKIIKEMKNLQSYIENNKDINFTINGYMLLSDIYISNSNIFSNAIDEAILLLEKAKAKDEGKKNFIIYERLGQAYYYKSIELIGTNEYKKNLFKALEQYNFITERGKKNSEIYRKKSEIYRDLEQYDLALICLEEAIKNDKEDYKNYVEAGLIYNENKDLTNAKKYYEEALKHKPDKNDYNFRQLEELVK